MQTISYRVLGPSSTFQNALCIELVQPIELAGYPLAFYTLHQDRLYLGIELEGLSETHPGFGCNTQAGYSQAELSALGFSLSPVP